MRKGQLGKVEGTAIELDAVMELVAVALALPEVMKEREHLRVAAVRMRGKMVAARATIPDTAEMEAARKAK